MSAAFPVRPEAEAGFSLVEVLVAMVLTGLVMTALALTTSQWLPNWQRGLGRVQQSELLGLALDRMAADIGAAQFVPANRESKAPLFEGRPAAITFVRDALGPNAVPGLEVVAFAEETEAGAVAMVRRTLPFVPRAKDVPPPSPGAPVALLRAPYRAVFSYAGRDGTWQDSWSGAEELPRAVRILVQDRASGRTLDASTVATIRAELPAVCVTDALIAMCGKALPAGGPSAPPAEPGGENGAPGSAP